jgi:CTP:molybdopterin cytidylyltransferase MocA
MSAAAPLTALILAGARAGGDPLADYAGVSHKALIDIDGRTMIERVVDALAAVPRVGRIVIAIERPQVLEGLAGLRCRVPVVPMLAASGPSASVSAALTQEGTPLLVTTGDHPLLRPEWIEQFLDHSPASADVSVALSRRESILRAVPDTQRTWLRFSDGDFSGCNIFYMRRPAAAGVVRLWQQIEADRKHPVRMVLRLGLGYALRYKAGRLRLDEALARLGELAQARLGWVDITDGRAAVDVDKPDDLDLVRRLMAQTR